MSVQTNRLFQEFEHHNLPCWATRCEKSITTKGKRCKSDNLVDLSEQLSNLSKVLPELIE